MDSSTTNLLHSVTCDSGDKPDDLTSSLCYRDGGSVIPATCNLERGPVASSSTREDSAVSILAGFLKTPFGLEADGVAARLISRHGSLTRVLNVGKEYDNGPENAAYAIIHAAHRLVEAALIERMSSQSVDPRDPALLKFLRLKFNRADNEQLQTIFLDREMKFKSHELLATGDDSKLTFNSSLIFRRCIDLGASVIILAHNHPSGCAMPSQADRESTTRFQQMAEFLGFTLADHIIFGANQAYSMRKGGLL